MPESRQRPKLAIVGASGTVGSQIAELIGQRDFTYAELKLFGAPTDREGAPIPADEPSEDIIELESADDLSEFDIVFIATPSAPAAALLARSSSSMKVDLSAASRAPADNLPLVAPGLTARERILEMRLAGAFGIPHPAAQVIAAVLQALGIGSEPVGATVILSASSWGREAIATLFNQSADLLNARLDLGDEETQTAFNFFLPSDADLTAAVIAAQVAALTETTPALVVQVARAPVFHGAAVAIVLPARPDTAQWATRLREAPGIVLVESGEASGSVDAAGQEAVIVKLAVTPSGATLWCMFDAARIAALSAIWIAETVSA
jgi:aspartate-semialdehyde dehydrogenase